VVIAKTDYDDAYFGFANGLHRDSGYHDYTAERRYNIVQDIRDGSNALLKQGTGNFYLDKLQWLISKTESLSNKSILELGCALGYMGEAALSLSLNWTGVDIYANAKAHAPTSVQSKLIVSDALAYLLTQGVNAFDFVVSFRFIECIDDLEMPALVTAMNKVGRKQIHIIDEAPNSEFYNAKTLEEWKSTFSWRKGTILVKNETLMSATPKIVVV
jgi:2-polyprenyl-3-methyl-5-hydroxy-6-metoxy-1,4-benzoquinol methylase